MCKKYKIPSEFDGKPLMLFLKSQGYSASMLKKMVHQGGVTVNGLFHRNIDAVKEGDVVVIDFPDIPPVLTPNSHLNVPVIFENEDFVIFDKPDNMLVHPAAKNFDDALGNFFAYRYPDISFRPLGRLDRHTTGLCFAAKNRLTAVTMHQKIKKEYLALAEGEISPEIGKIVAPLRRENGAIIKRIVSPSGKNAVTHYESLKKHKNYTFLKLILETGRTHQIRAHLSHIGHPLAGDTLYGGDTNLIQRQALHCSTMSFLWQNEEFFITADIPEDMKRALNILNLYNN